MSEREILKQTVLNWFVGPDEETIFPKNMFYSWHVMLFYHGVCTCCYLNTQVDHYLYLKPGIARFH